ncbi:UNVERIFIED_ORG: DNA-binding NarL/FixJ family response regulator [Variovorax paradoxus]|nr:DNA-binding NarL/FixJ family response regulator [Variovorax paradoxus]
MTLAVFIVEDEPLIQDSLKVVLEGYLQAEVVGTALSEAEAVAWLQANEEAWQLLVVDLLLKQGTGLGVLAALSALGGKRGIVVALTNAASPDNRAECIRLGADAVFDKAAEVNEFLAYCAAEH